MIWQLLQVRKPYGTPLIKPSTVIAGKACPRPSSVEQGATATLRCLRRHVPAAVPGIVFLSGGQSDRVATLQQALLHRVHCNGAASLGQYTGAMEGA